MIHKKILPEYKLTIMCFVGIVTPEDALRFLEGLNKEPEYDKSYNSIIDFRDALLTYDAEGLRKTLQFILEKNAGNRRTAYITSEPRHVIPPSMMKSNEFQMPMDVKIFSTVESALDWLVMDDLSAEDYEQIILELKAS